LSGSFAAWTNRGVLPIEFKVLVRGLSWQIKAVSVSRLQSVRRSKFKFEMGGETCTTKEIQISKMNVVDDVQSQRTVLLPMSG
jgi:hypothetical protein